MRTRLTDDELAIQDAFAGFFTNESPIEVVRAAEPLGHDPQLWSKLAATGAPAMALAADAGGGDGALSDLAVVVDLWGAHLAPVPLIEHAVASRLLSALGADADVIAGLATADSIATLALRPSTDGIARLVPAGAVADVVVALENETVVVDRSAPPGVGRRNTGDLPLADRDLTAAVVVAAGPEAVRAWDSALNDWRALMAVAHVGLARRAIEIAVDYVRERHQFGVAVGTFQAVQHGLADAATSIEGAHLLAHRAIWALETDQTDAPRLATMALLFASETARHATDRALQYHGGYGFAEEYDIQLYHRRASAWILQLGEPAIEYARLAEAEFGPKAIV